MQGGRIIGEGADGCVLTEPMWPCSADSLKGPVPSLGDNRYVSKITLKTDMESIYRKSAQILLGQFSSRYLTVIQGECSPADSKHPPPQTKMDVYKSAEGSLINWKHSRDACKDLKTLIKTSKGISETHKIMYITKYLINVKDWLLTNKQPPNQIIQSIIPAIRPFLEVLQLLYQQDYEQLIHLDLHIGNMFVKPQQGRSPLQFGLTDFGHCLLRRTSDTKEKQAQMFFGKYLCDYIARFIIHIDYPQPPLEARILNFCFMRQLENVNPGSLVRSWAFESNKTTSLYEDLISIEANGYVEQLLKKPLFIAMIEHIQSISKKLRINQKDPVVLVQSLSSQEQIVLEYILTRYDSFSPINTITQAIIKLSSDVSGKKPQLTVHSYFGKKDAYGRIHEQKSTNLTYFIDFLERLIIAPYEQDGSSLSSALTSVQSGDIRIIWDDVTKSA